MAQRTQTILIDDVDGGEGAETVTFALDGVTYEIDLSKSNASALRDAMAPWVGHGRRVPGRSSGTARIGGRHAVCLAVHKSVWMDVGYFQPVPKLLGYEDTLFFHELEKAKIPVGITGASWLHHYGSVTQTAMKQERGLAAKDGLGYRYNYKLLNQSWLTRKLAKSQRVAQQKKWRQEELAAHAMTIHGLRESGQFRWI